MERMSLPPGFRFHPTDVELIMYYLKRKAMRKKLHAEAIAEINIYKFSPWDLPDMSCLKSKDQEWFFFCPIERKYASGARVKRATENGYWKTTGKERFVYYDDKTVGTVKTLVFHFGHAPKGERTDWVIHEYKMLDDQLAAAEIQDTYVLCKVFKKNGPGPKVGANYGAPFTEEDWSDDYIDVAENHATSLTPDVPSDSALLPQKQGCVTGLLDPGSMACPLLIGEGSNEMQASVVTDLFHPGSTSGLPLVEGLAPSTKPASELIEHEFDDDIISLWTSFTDDTLLLINENIDHKDDLSGKREKKSVHIDGCNDIYSGLQDLNSVIQMNVERLDPAWMQNDDYTLYNMLSQEKSDYIEVNDLQAPLNCSTGYKENSGFQDDLGGKREKKSVHIDGCHDIYSGLQDLNSSVQMNGERLDPAWMQNDDFTLYNMLLQDNSDYIELNDLQAPLNCSTGVIGNNDQVYDIFESYNHGNVPQFCFTCMDHTACYRDQLHVLTDRLDWKENHFDGHHRVNYQFYQESDAVYDSAAHTQSSNGESAGLCFNQDMNGNR